MRSLSFDFYSYADFAKDDGIYLSFTRPLVHGPTAAWDMQKFWYNVTKAGVVKYGSLCPDRKEWKWCRLV